MLSILYAIISGISMTLQGVFNTKLEEKVGTWETNVIVQGTALIITLVIVMFLGKGDFKSIKDVNKLYLVRWSSWSNNYFYCYEKHRCNGRYARY